MDANRFTSLLNLSALVVIMLSMGMQVKLADVVAAARQVRLVLLAVLANYLAVPLVTVALLHAFQADPQVSAGFLILAVCPGAPVAPPLVAMGKGDLPSAIGSMVILAALSAVLSPLMLSWLLARLVPEGELHIDYLAIARTLLVAQLLPLGLGLGIRHLKPKLTERFARPLALLANLLLVGLVVAILVSQFQTLAAIRVRGWFGMSLLLVACLAIGWLCGGKTRSTRLSMALTTAVRNAAVGLVIATANFAGTPAVTAVVAYGLVSLLGAAAFAKLVGSATPPALSTRGAVT